MGALFVINSPSDQEDKNPKGGFAPCKSPCLHIDCHQAIKDVNQSCVECGKAIGFDVEYRILGPTYEKPGPIHASPCFGRLVGRIRNEAAGGESRS